jgi:hypothetical protein
MLPASGAIYLDAFAFGRGGNVSVGAYAINVT